MHDTEQTITITYTAVNSSWFMGASSQTFILHRQHHDNRLHLHCSRLLKLLPLSFLGLRKKLLRRQCRDRSITPPTKITYYVQAAHAANERADRTRKYYVHIHVHVSRRSVIYSALGCRQNVCCCVYNTYVDVGRMRRMLILSQCLDIKSMLSDVSYELRILMCLVIAVLVLSVLKIVYYHVSNTHHVRKIKHLLETRRYNWRSGDLAVGTPVSPLPKIERVSGCLSLRRRSGQASSVHITETEHIVLPHSPPSRDCTKPSTGERHDTEPRRRKNQILAAQMLL